MSVRSLRLPLLVAAIVGLALFAAHLLGLMACGASNAPAESTAETSSAEDLAPQEEPSPPLDGSPEREPPCPRFDEGQVLGRVETLEVAEASGLVASRRQPEVLWVHNDSGDQGRLFALSTDGKLLATYLLDVPALDWEDMALGPGPEEGVDYLYIGDIGDNLSTRDSVTVYRLPEPTVRDQGGRIDAADILALELRYPDGSHDAETLLSDPQTGDLYIITKTLFAPGPTQLFRYSAEALAAGANELEALGEIDLVNGDVVTAGDIAADGGTILLRGYLSAKLWTRAEGQSLLGAMTAVPCEVPVIGFPTEPKGESIAFDADGLRYFTLSEGRQQPIYAFKRAD